MALAFPWLQIRKDEAYPVFTDASSDQRSPWLNTPADFDESGQINAYFRCKNLVDVPSKFVIELWIAHPSVEQLAMPDSATADVTLRRLQRFRTQPACKYTWQLSSQGHIVASGNLTPDASNLLTISHLTLTTVPAALSVSLSAQ